MNYFLKWLWDLCFFNGFIFSKFKYSLFSSSHFSISSSCKFSFYVYWTYPLLLSSGTKGQIFKLITSPNVSTFFYNVFASYWMFTSSILFDLSDTNEELTFLIWSLLGRARRLSHLGLTFFKLLGGDTLIFPIITLCLLENLLDAVFFDPDFFLNEGCFGYFYCSWMNFGFLL